MKKFTLIELLVVVAIIGILASLLLPTLGKARKKSQMAVCKSNMKQIGTLIFMYGDDNDDYFPVANTPAGFTWDDRLSDYDGRNLSNAHKVNGAVRTSWGYGSQLYACPDDSIERFWGTSQDVDVRSYGLTHRQNAASGDVADWAPGVSSWAFSQQMSQVPSPSRTLALVEHSKKQYIVGNQNGTTAKPNSDYDLYATLHDGIAGSNYLMVDGSVQKLTYNATLTKTDGTMSTANGLTDSMWDAR